MIRSTRASLFLLALTALPAVARAQVSLGFEFRVHTYTTNNQAAPAVARTAGGGFVVVWTSFGQDGDGSGVIGRRFNAAGLFEGAEFVVNAYTTGSQTGPAVASDANGRFVVVWQGSQDGSFSSVHAQRFDASGVREGSELQVNTYTTGGQVNPAVASDADGNLVVVWTGAGAGDNVGIFGQRYSSSGAPSGGEFRVNSYAAAGQYWPAVASDASGAFVVAWQSGMGQDGGGQGVFAQRYDADAVAQGSEFSVNTYTTSNQTFPSVASAADGRFVVVWGSAGQDGSGYGVFAQRYDASGTEQGFEFQVNAAITGDQDRAAVAWDAGGRFVVVWRTKAGAAGYEVLGRQFAADGAPFGDDFAVNTYTTGAQVDPAVAIDAAGNFVVAWTTDRDSSGTAVFARRFAQDGIFRDGFE